MCTVAPAVYPCSPCHSLDELPKSFTSILTSDYIRFTSSLLILEGNEPCKKPQFIQDCKEEGVSENVTCSVGLLLY